MPDQPSARVEDVEQLLGVDLLRGREDDDLEQPRAPLEKGSRCGRVRTWTACVLPASATSNEKRETAPGGGAGPSFRPTPEMPEGPRGRSARRAPGPGCCGRASRPGPGPASVSPRRRGPPRPEAAGGPGPEHVARACGGAFGVGLAACLELCRRAGEVFFEVALFVGVSRSSLSSSPFSPPSPSPRCCCCSLPPRPLFRRGEKPISVSSMPMSIPRAEGGKRASRGGKALMKA